MLPTNISDKDPDQDSTSSVEDIATEDHISDDGHDLEEVVLPPWFGFSD